MRTLSGMHQIVIIRFILFIIANQIIILCNGLLKYLKKCGATTQVIRWIKRSKCPADTYLWVIKPLFMAGS